MRISYKFLGFILVIFIALDLILFIAVQFNSHFKPVDSPPLKSDTLLTVDNQNPKIELKSYDKKAIINLLKAREIFSKKILLEYQHNKQLPGNKVLVSSVAIHLTNILPPFITEKTILSSGKVVDFIGYSEDYNNSTNKLEIYLYVSSQVADVISPSQLSNAYGYGLLTSIWNLTRSPNTESLDSFTKRNAKEYFRIRKI